MRSDQTDAARQAGVSRAAPDGGGVGKAVIAVGRDIRELTEPAAEPGDEPSRSSRETVTAVMPVRRISARRAMPRSRGSAASCSDWVRGSSDTVPRVF